MLGFQIQQSCKLSTNLHPHYRVLSLQYQFGMNFKILGCATCSSCMCLLCCSQKTNARIWLHWFFFFFFFCVSVFFFFFVFVFWFFFPIYLRFLTLWVWFFFLKFLCNEPLNRPLNMTDTNVPPARKEMMLHLTNQAWYATRSICQKLGSHHDYLQKQAMLKSWSLPLKMPSKMIQIPLMRTYLFIQFTYK